MQLTNETISPFLSWWHGERHKCRTDLLYLCNQVLGYRDVSREVHGAILDGLQGFAGAVEGHKTVQDFADAMRGKVLWEPKCGMELLPSNSVQEWNGKDVVVDSRQTLFLYPRGHLKSTVITVAHSIQWILNYPNIRILLTTATETLVTGFIIEIRSHFINNEQLRQLFPELCPQSRDGKIPELGNLSGFTCPARDNTNKKLGPGGKEPTVLASTVGSAITGYHGDVIKDDDLVEKVNSSSQNGIDEVIRHFGSMGDLLEKYNSSDPNRPLKGWVDVVGTPWDFSDLYQVIRNSEGDREQKGLAPHWCRVIRSAAPNWPDGPYLWPERMGYKALKEIEDDPTKGPSQLSAQYLMNPIVVGQGLIDDIRNLQWMEPLKMGVLLPRMQLRARLDLAGMAHNAKGMDNDYTCLTIGGFYDGSLYVPWMRYGRPPVEGVVEWIFEMFSEFPQLVELTVENASGANPLESWLRREMSEKGVWLPIRFVPRTNQQSKVNRIKALRPWFEGGKIQLSAGIGYRVQIESEIKGFPKYRHDDFLDTLSDLMTDSKGVPNSGVVLMNSELMQGVQQTNIEMLLAQHEFEQNSRQGYNPVTGFPL